MAGKRIIPANADAVRELTGQPFLRTLRDVQRYVEREFDAQGFTFRGGKLLALKFFEDGTPYVIGEVEFQEFGGSA